MTTTEIIEVALAALLIGAGIWLQVRSKRVDAQHGSQGAVILMAIGAIMAIHGLGLLEYRAPESGL
jgi:predicted transporter